MHNSHGNFSSYRCVACNIYFNSFEEQKQHYFTYHSRSFDHESLTSSLYSQYKPLSEINKKAIPVNCDMCNISCSSQATYEFHIKGKKHAKALTKKALCKNEKTVNCALLEQSSKDTVPFEHSTEISVTIKQSQILYKPNLVCEICNVNCPKLDQLEKHFEGIRHQKNIKLKRYIELKNNRDPSVFCHKCDIFMNEESMASHRSSGKHKRKNTDKVKDEPAEKKTRSADIPTTVEHCGYCHLSLKNPNDAIAHYQTQKHAFNMTNRSRNFELWCDACQMSFTNQNFLDLHLKGFKHFVRVNRDNANPEGGAFGERLIKMREKLQSLKQSKKDKKLIKADQQHNIVPDEPSNEPLIEEAGENSELLINNN